MYIRWKDEPIGSLIDTPHPLRIIKKGPPNIRWTFFRLTETHKLE